MKESKIPAVMLMMTLLPLFAIVECLRSNPGAPMILREEDDSNQTFQRDIEKGDLSKEIYASGSSLPDCSHACGPCFPCKRVMVSFKCTVAESCPIVYRCMCRGRYYQVPSS